MKIAIIGPGALGTLFAGLLARSGQEVWLIDHNPSRARKIQHSGLKIVGSSRFVVHSKEFKITVEPKNIVCPDLVIVLVKAYDTLNAAKKIKPIVGKNTIIMTLQNGLGNLEVLAKVFGKEKVLGGITAYGATLLGPGKVRHAGVGKTVIGWYSGTPEIRNSRTCELRNLRTIVQIFNQAKIPTEITANLESVIWSKLVLNSAVNPLAAITRKRNGELIQDKWLRMMLCATVCESAEAAKAKGIRLAYSDPQKKVLEVCHATKYNMNSMLQDVLSHKTTEIEYINGKIVSEAKKLGIPVPLNTILIQLVKEI